MRNYGCNAERKTLFSEKGVSAVSRAIGPDHAVFGEVGDVLVFDISTGPLTVVAFAFGEGLSYRVQAGNEFAVSTENVEDLGAYAGHDVHVADNVLGVGDFNTDFGDVRTNRTHGEGDNIHGASLHTTGVEAGHGFFQFVGINPVVGRSGRFLGLCLRCRCGFPHGLRLRAENGKERCSDAF